MSQRLTVLVTGATGKQGGAVARLLLRNGHAVRALVRKPDSTAARDLELRGARLFAGDLTDHASLRRAMDGADAAFGMSTPFEGGMQAELQQGTTLANAAKEALVHLVYSSVASADRSTAIPHFDSKWKIERHIGNIGLGATIIRPVYFMENLIAFGLSGLREGRLSLPLRPDVKLQQIAVSDIGELAVLAIEQRQRFAGLSIDIASDELTGEEAARLISRAMGREIEYSQMPIEMMRASSDDMATMYEWFDRVGYDVDIQKLRGKYPAIKWHTYEAWANEQNLAVLAGSPPARPSQRRAFEEAKSHPI
jgi:uncharacterized protein YbjT (DUF2867 family)